MGVDLLDVDAIAEERVDAIGQEGANVDALAEHRPKHKDGRPSAAVHQSLRFFFGADQFDVHVRLGQVVLHDTAPRLERMGRLLHALGLSQGRGQATECGNRRQHQPAGTRCARRTPDLD